MGKEVKKMLSVPSEIVQNLKVAEKQIAKAVKVCRNTVEECLAEREEMLVQFHSTAVFPNLRLTYCQMSQDHCGL